jgi:uncharacterized repeat protein (TIGR03803 family)
MKTRILVTIALSLLAHCANCAELSTPFSVLHHFNDSIDGSSVWAGVAVTESKLFAATSSLSRLFSLNKDGSDFRRIQGFEGRSIKVTPTVVGSKLYGVSTEGGGFAAGSIFSINFDGTGYQVLHTFSRLDGESPFGSLTLVGSTLYGVTNEGGSADCGTIYSIQTDGTGFRTLHSFLGGNDDGRSPSGALTTDGTTLYGATPAGGPGNDGTVYSISADGSGYEVLKTFSTAAVKSPLTVVLKDQMLYGTATSDKGGVFTLQTDGSGLTYIHKFTGQDGDGPSTNASLVVSGSTIYGTTLFGGSFDRGVVYQMGTDGSGFQKLHEFSGEDGALVRAGVTLDGNTLFGTTLFGGDSNGGTVFALAIPEPTGFALAMSVCVISLWYLAGHRCWW